MVSLSRKRQQVSNLIVAVISLVFVRGMIYGVPFLFPDGNLDSLSTQNLILLVLAASAFFTVSFAALAGFYDAILWKYHLRRHNFSGYWAMKITYETAERLVSRGEKLPTPYYFESVFKVEQEFDHVVFAEGFSATNEVWRDTSLRLTDNGFFMSYHVRRSDKGPKDPLPHEVIGIEEVEVTERNWIGWPVFMQGKMYHAAIPISPLYRGSTIYRRLSKRKYEELLCDMQSGAYSTIYSGR